MLLLDESDSVTDQDRSVGYSSENESQGSDCLQWHCGPPSSSLLSENQAQMSSCPLSHLEGHGQNLGLNSNKKRISKPAHMRRNIRKVPLRLTEISSSRESCPRKLLKEHHLDAITKVARLEETERLKHLNQQRTNLTVASELVCTHMLGDLCECVSYGSKGSAAFVQTSNSSKAHSIEVSVLQTTPSTRDQSSFENTTSCFISKSDSKDGTRSVVQLSSTVNQPDAQGRVLININHPEDESDIYLSPQIARIIKPHQIDGIRFLYSNLVESQKRFKSTPGFGCILAHSMGLGKTLQVISFIDILLRHTGVHTVLAIVPVNTLQNWLAEFNLWVPSAEALPPHNETGHIVPRSFKVHILNDEYKTTSSRAKVVEDWYRNGGVLLMGYEMYRLLSLKKCFVTGRKKKNTKSNEPVITDIDKEEHQQELMKGIERALSQPGPDVVVCDEGHRIKNWHASTSRALKSIGTMRRLLLTGYPLQNNLNEYWCMVDFVRPGFLGTRPEFSNMFVRPILNGQCVDSTPEDVQLMRYRSHVLHSLLEGFVQRRGHDVLFSQLPQKQEHVILVRLTALQRTLYTAFMNRFREAGNTGWLNLNPLKAFCVCCKIWNHPDILFEALQKENMASEQDLDMDDITASNAYCSASKRAKPSESSSSQRDITLHQLQEKNNQAITYEWAKDIMAGYKKGILENSAKMVLFFHIVEESVKSGEKVLVFSQSLSTLTVIEEFLGKRTMPDYSGNGVKQTWVRNVNYYRLDGSTSVSERERLINQFNDMTNNSSWLFLLSTRAGCLGVNLIGASRVVVFDASWNPCHDAQAVCRVYRYGQRKPCHIYRLVSDFTLEKKIYDRQISKQGMSDRVIDDLNPVLTFTHREVESLLHFAEDETNPLDSTHLLQPQEDMETVLKEACMRYPHLITKQPFHHESLMMDRQDLKLTEEEKQEAKKSYENEKRASVPYTRPSYAHYYPASAQSLTNIPAFSQRNWRPPSQLKNKPAASIQLAETTRTPIMHQNEGQKEDPKKIQDSAPQDLRLSSKSDLNFPVTYLQKAGVFVQKTVTTTDIVIPGTNDLSDRPTKISAGESIHIIRGTKGTYIRTSDGRIFAIRAVRKCKQCEEKDLTSALENSTSKSISDSASPDDTPKILTPKTMARPLFSDTPEILSELQHYAKVPPLPLSGVANTETKKGVMILPQNNTATPDIEMPLDLRGTKRKSTSPSTNKYCSKQQTPEPKGSVPLSGQNYPFKGTYSINSAISPGVNHALLNSVSSMWSPYFQPQVPTAEHQLMFPISPDSYSVRERALPSSSPTSSSITSSTAASSSSSISVGSSCLMSHQVPGMLPPTYLTQFRQPLNMYSSTHKHQGIPGKAASSFLPQYLSSSSQGGANKSCLVGDNGAPRSEDSSHICDSHGDVIAMMDQ
ncbi:helicase ARIP4-like isoform X1 [Silurus meridionalis]|uniref:helicase ARIP4-like isoform X1 n=1 Tax=Silurus meridionalis TaxID=175797 RepID=UPI001EEA1D9E|nr:helicase ARIP4-like isoform X1 [Silurus meridionalis]